jgi:hypothetical protein
MLCYILVYVLISDQIFFQETVKENIMTSIVIIIIIITSWLKSASELYRPSDCLLSATLVPTFSETGLSDYMCIEAIM